MLCSRKHLRPTSLRRWKIFRALRFETVLTSARALGLKGTVLAERRRDNLLVAGLAAKRGVIRGHLRSIPGLADSHAEGKATSAGHHSVRMLVKIKKRSSRRVPEIDPARRPAPKA